MPDLATNGKPGRVRGTVASGIDVHLDVITRIQRSSEYRRTETALEKGAALTVHRQRTPETLVLEIVASDVEPHAGAQIIGRWEPNHAALTLQRLQAAQAADSELRVWTGEQYERTPAGTRVWVLDKIDGPGLDGAETGVLRATLTFGESPRFATQFTAALPEAADDLADVVGDAAERGRQSTTAANGSAAADVAAGSFP